MKHVAEGRGGLGLVRPALIILQFAILTGAVPSRVADVPRVCGWWQLFVEATRTDIGDDYKISPFDGLVGLAFSSLR